MIQQLREAFPYDSSPTCLIFDCGAIFNAAAVDFIKAMGTTPIIRCDDIVQRLNLIVFWWFYRVAWFRILALGQQLAVYKRKTKSRGCAIGIGCSGRCSPRFGVTGHRS